MYKVFCFIYHRNKCNGVLVHASEKLGSACTSTVHSGSWLLSQRLLRLRCIDTGLHWARDIRLFSVQTVTIFTGYQTIDSQFPRSRTMYSEDFTSRSKGLSDLKAANAMNATLSSSLADITTKPRGPINLSIQEQAGINTTFPGKTEYMTRYKLPPYDIKTSHFTINPTPDFKLHGRPLGLTTYTPSFTEYQVRYEWPDGNKIVKLPWRRK